MFMGTKLIRNKLEIVNIMSICWTMVHYLINDFPECTCGCICRWGKHLNHHQLSELYHLP